MAEKIIKTIIQIRRDTEANWLLNKDVIPASGEPCLTLDGAYAGQVKYGDGVSTWEQLPYSGMTSVEGDGLTTTVNGNVISLLGAHAAVVGQTIRIGTNGQLEWYTPKALENPEEIQGSVAALETEVDSLTASISAIEQTVGSKADADSVYSKEEANARFIERSYEFVDVPYGSIVDYSDKEIRIMCPSDFEWKTQAVGETGDANKYYLPFRAYAPSDNIVSFKEDTAETINDDTMWYFENNSFAGVDEFGRKYSLVWLAVAYYDTSASKWVYYGDLSNEDHMLGFHYSVRWYDENGTVVAADHIRINITNKDCHYSLKPYVLENVVDYIPIATATSVGIVKGSDEIIVNADGSLSIATVSFDKIISGEDTIVMDGGGASL